MSEEQNTPKESQVQTEAEEKPATPNSAINEVTGGEENENQLNQDKIDSEEAIKKDENTNSQQQTGEYSNERNENQNENNENSNERNENKNESNENQNDNKDNNNEKADNKNENNDNNNENDVNSNDKNQNHDDLSDSSVSSNTDPGMIALSEYCPFIADVPISSYADPFPIPHPDTRSEEEIEQIKNRIKKLGNKKKFDPPIPLSDFCLFAKERWDKEEDNSADSSQCLLL